jgi:DNA repair photolyase
MAGEALFELQRQTFDTPNFRGIEFIETEAKSILNHVKGNLPFNWSINAYRGCQHACSYCLGGETPILLANGRTEIIKNLRVGDELVGTTVVGRYRRYPTTEVLDHWETLKPAYRVSLDDGTELVASGDHRFLSDRGWKHVTGTECGRARRAHLTLNSKLMGLGAFATSPEHSGDYRRGYLCGMIRGDANLGHYRYERAGRTHGDVYRFRLALTDFEALERSRKFLEQVGIETDLFTFSEADQRHALAQAIRTSSRWKIEAIQKLISWPSDPSPEWTQGFLAGIYDAEGSYSCGILRISNCDPEIIQWICRSLDAFSFSYAIETPRRREGLKPIQCIRVRGGLHERLRFFLTTDPAITRKRTFEGAAIKNPACPRVVSIQDLGLEIPMYDITTGTGDFIANGVVSHNCFARNTHTFLDMNAGRDFETKIVVKVNAPELLRKELRAKRWKGELIAMGTNTDPYQRAEGKYKLTRGIIQVLTEYRNPFSILTKGTLILRDLPLLEKAAEVTEVGTSFSIPTFDEDVWRKSEPGTPHPRKRMEAVARLNEAGIPCGVLVAPILPGISDGRDQIKEVIDAAYDAGATHVYPILLHLRPGVKEVYMEWLQDAYPDLVTRYEDMYRNRSYATAADKQELSNKVGSLMEGRRPMARERKRPVTQARARQELDRLENQQLALL